MSPTVLTEEGYRVVIYLNDHPPAHVHVKKAGSEARVTLEPVQIVSNYGFKGSELRKVEALIVTYRTFLLDQWDMYHETR